MHYCQVCDDAPLMTPAEGGTARCTTCGSIDLAARREPLLVVTGASGAGKTTVFPELARELRGECMVFDTDWLIDPLGGDVTTLDWVALRDSWLHVAHGVAQNGLPTLLLGGFVPEELERLPGRRWIDGVHFLLLDCEDPERRRRIEARPAARTHDVEPQVAFGRWLRASISTAVDTTNGTPEDAAESVGHWAREVLKRSRG